MKRRTFLAAIAALPVGLLSLSGFTTKKRLREIYADGNRVRMREVQVGQQVEIREDGELIARGKCVGGPMYVDGRWGCKMVPNG